MGRPTGVGRYLARTAARVGGPRRRASASRHEFVLYGPAPLPAGVAARVRGASRRRVRVVPGAGGTWWEQVDAAARAAARRPRRVLRAGLHGSAAARAARSSLTIHDLSFFAHPSGSGAREGLRRRTADAPVGPPRGGRADRLRVLRGGDPGAPRRARRAHPRDPAGRRRRRRAARRPARRRRRRAREPLVLFVGSIFNRRRVPDLIAAFAARRAARAGRPAGDHRREPDVSPPGPRGAVPRPPGLGDRVSRPLVRARTPNWRTRSGRRRCSRSCRSTRASA